MKTTETKAKKIESLADKCDFSLDTLSDILKHLVYCEFRNIEQLSDYTLSMRKIKEMREQLGLIESTLIKKLNEGNK